jgi:hypothetical protein
MRHPHGSIHGFVHDWFHDLTVDVHVCMYVCVLGSAVFRLVFRIEEAINAGDSFSLSRQSGQHKFNNAMGRPKSYIVIVLTIILISLVLVLHSARRLLTEFPFHSRSGIDALGSLSHYLEAIVCTAKQ